MTERDSLEEQFKFSYAMWVKSYRSPEITHKERELLWQAYSRARDAFENVKHTARLWADLSTADQIRKLHEMEGV